MPERPRAGGWNWLGDWPFPRPRKTAFAENWDGLFVAQCPGCQRDTIWHAYSQEPMCECEVTA